MNAIQMMLQKSRVQQAHVTTIQSRQIVTVPCWSSLQTVSSKST